MSDNKEQLLRIIDSYNKLEKAHKASQLATLDFGASIINEHRYFARAIVDYLSTVDSDDSSTVKAGALAKAEIAVSAALNDIIDSICHHIKSTIVDFKNVYDHKILRPILEDYEYDKVIDALIDADAMIIESRENRSHRFEQYYQFTQKAEFERLIKFSTNLIKIEYLCNESKNNPDDSRRVTLARELKRAFAHHSESDLPRLELHYQGKFSNKKKIIGAEALVRFKDSEGESISAQEIVQLAEDLNLKSELDNWVMKKALVDFRYWQQNQLLGEDFQLSINVTPSEFLNDVYATKLTTELALHKINPKCIALELTENWIENSNEFQISVINHNLLGLPEGTPIFIDDFGAGNTKLHHISFLHGLQKIKIDKSLIDPIASKNHKKALQLISGIYEFSKKNSLGSVAEGIETEAQLEALIELGITELQGYILARPVNRTTFESSFLRS